MTGQRRSSYRAGQPSVIKSVSFDAADALALAITHIWRGGAQARIDAALAAAGSTAERHRR